MTAEISENPENNEIITEQISDEPKPTLSRPAIDMLYHLLDLRELEMKEKELIKKAKKSDFRVIMHPTSVTKFHKQFTEENFIEPFTSDEKHSFKLTTDGKYLAYLFKVIDILFEKGKIPESEEKNKVLSDQEIKIINKVIELSEVYKQKDQGRRIHYSMAKVL